MYKRKKYITAIVVFFLLLISCSKDKAALSDQDFNSTYGGKQFVGTAKAVLSRNGFPGTTLTGDAHIALIEVKEDSLSMVFMSDFGEDGEINFKIRGKFDKTSYRFERNESTSFFRIIDEKISGNFISSGQEMNFDGVLQREQAQMTVKVDFIEEHETFPKGTRLELHFNTKRDLQDGNKEQGCQMRLVPIWSSNGVTMGMVPDC